MGAVSARARAIWRSCIPDTIRFKIGNVREAHRAVSWRRPRRLGELRRTTPFSTWGESRGGPIDRYYVSEFIGLHANDVRGRVLEVAGDEYASTHGRGVERIDVLDIDEDNPMATFVGDIADAPSLPDDTFDCVLVTQLLPFVWDVGGAFATCHRVLRPGGVLLVTTPGICRIAPVEAELYGHWWNLTSMSAERLASEAFGAESVEVTTYGNVLAAAGYLFGLGLNDLSPGKLDFHDPAFQVTVGVRAVKRRPDGS